MAHITLNADTALTSAALALPDNARIIVIDADTEDETADLAISGAESLIITGEDAQITTVTDNDTDSADDDTDIDDDAFVDAVIASMLDMLGASPRDIKEQLDAVRNDRPTDDDDADETVSDNNDDEADTDSKDDNNTDDNADSADDEVAAVPAALTAIRDARSVDYSYTIRVEYDSDRNIYTDLTTDTEIAEGAIIDIINRASETEAGVSMRFNIPTHGVTTFTGDLVANYNGYTGLALVGGSGGAYVLNAEQNLTDDMSVLEEATFTFIGDADMLFADLDINIIDIDEYEGRTADAVTNTDTEDEGEDDDDSADADAAPQRGRARIRTFDADEQLYVSIYSRSHDLRSTDICRIISYAAANGLSARMTVDDTDEPYVGRLEVRDTDTRSGTYSFVDKKFGVGKISLNKADDDPGFDTLEIYSDTNMRRRGFAGTNHTDYVEISVVEMAKHINTALDV